MAAQMLFTGLSRGEANGQPTDQRQHQDTAKKGSHAEQAIA